MKPKTKHIATRAEHRHVEQRLADVDDQPRREFAFITPEVLMLAIACLLCWFGADSTAELMGWDTDLDKLNAMEFLFGVGVALIVVAGIGVAGYFVLRRLFERMSAQMADHIGRVLAELATVAATTRAGQRTEYAARAAAGRFTHLGAYAAAEGISEDQARRQFTESIERTARIMDSAVILPIVGPVGLDALLGLFPVAGDTVAAAVSISLIARSLKYGVPREIIARMLGNVLFDLLLGAVPVVGDIADMWFRSNARNAALLREYLGDEARNTIDVTPTRSA